MSASFSVCVAGRKPGPERNGACRLCDELARYVVLLPPSVARPTPTPVFLPGEVITSSKRRTREIPTYCKTHAYEIAGIPLPT
jgi:hypothetical protein